jgi:hypothetical protein
MKVYEVTVEIEVYSDLDDPDEVEAETVKMILDQKRFTGSSFLRTVSAQWIERIDRRDED